MSLSNKPSIDQIKRVPKALLHDHLDGGLRPQTIIDIAEKIGYKKLPTHDPVELGKWFEESCNSGSLVRYLETFSHTIAVMQTQESIIQVARECAIDLANDGVVYAEVRGAPELFTEQGLSIDQVVEATTEGYKQGMAEAAKAGKIIRVESLLCGMRQAGRSQEAAEAVVKYRDKGVVGFDIAGPEDGFPPTKQLETFEYLRQENAHFTIHAGEAYGLPSIWEAIPRKTLANRSPSAAVELLPLLRPLPKRSRILIVSSIIAAKSSFLPREPEAIEGGASTIETESACGPRRPSAIEKSNFVPGFTVVTPSGNAAAAR